MAKHNHRSLRRMLLEMTHGRHALAVREKKVRNDQIEGPLLQDTQPVEQGLDAHPFDVSLESIPQRRLDLFCRMLFGADEEYRVFTHVLYPSLTFSVHTAGQHSQ